MALPVVALEFTSRCRLRLGATIRGGGAWGQGGQRGTGRGQLGRDQVNHAPARSGSRRTSRRFFRTRVLRPVTPGFESILPANLPWFDISDQRDLPWRVCLLIDLDIRAIKIQLGMDVLRCQSPEMVRREIWTCLLAYNLIRKTILESAKRSDLSPRQISFTAAMQKVAASWESVLLLSEASLALLVEADLEHLAGHRVGHRPNRVEPRKVKRRPKPHKWLTEPRDTARERLLSGQD